MGNRARIEEVDSVPAPTKFEGRGDAIDAGAEDDDGGHRVKRG